MCFSFIYGIKPIHVGLINQSVYYRKRVNIYFYNTFTYSKQHFVSSQCLARCQFSMLSVTEKIIRQLRNISIFHQFIFNSYIYTHLLEHDWSMISQTITFIDILSKNIFLNRHHKLDPEYIHHSFSYNLEKRRKKSKHNICSKEVKCIVNFNQ